MSEKLIPPEKPKPSGWQPEGPKSAISDSAPKQADHSAKENLAQRISRIRQVWECFDDLAQIHRRLDEAMRDNPYLADRLADPLSRWIEAAGEVEEVLR